LGPQTLIGAPEKVTFAFWIIQTGNHS